MERLRSAERRARPARVRFVATPFVLALTAGITLCACAPTSDANEGPQEYILPNLPSALPQIASGTSCKELGPAIDFSEIMGMCLDEPQEGHSLYPEIVVGGAATTAETTTLAFTFYCESAEGDLVFAVMDQNLSSAPTTTSASCAKEGAANHAVITIPDEWLGRELSVHGPSIDFTMLAAFSWV